MTNKRKRWYDHNDEKVVFILRVSFIVLIIFAVFNLNTCAIGDLKNERDFNVTSSE